MATRLILASGSDIRQALLRQAGVAFEVVRPRVDEETARDAMLAEAAAPRDIADMLADMKARKVSDKHPDAMVIGCDQVLSFDGGLMSKPKDKAEARTQLQQMRGKHHELLSAVVICKAGQPVWRDVGRVTLEMRQMSDTYLNAYVDRNWESIQHSVGGYKLEEEGVRLFTTIQGDYFTVLGLPLLSLISYLNLRGVLEQ